MCFRQMKLVTRIQSLQKRRVMHAERTDRTERHGDQLESVNSYDQRQIMMTKDQYEG